MPPVITAGMVGRGRFALLLAGVFVLAAGESGPGSSHHSGRGVMSEQAVASHSRSADSKVPHIVLVFLHGGGVFAARLMIIRVGDEGCQHQPGEHGGGSKATICLGKFH